MGVKFGMEQGTEGTVPSSMPMDEGTFVPSSMPNFTPIGAACQKPQNWPLSKLNTGSLRFAQCCR